jgi:hypothetical protein
LANALAQPGEKTDMALATTMNSSVGPGGTTESAFRDLLATRKSSGSIFKADSYQVFDPDEGKQVDIPKAVFMKIRDAAGDGRSEEALKIYDDFKKNITPAKSPTLANPTADSSGNIQGGTIGDNISAAASDAYDSLFGGKATATPSAAAAIPVAQNNMNNLDQSRDAAVASTPAPAPIIINGGGGGGGSQSAPPPPAAVQTGVGSASRNGSINRFEDKLTGSHADYIP